MPRPRRLLSPVPLTHAGQLVALDAAQSHHARDVLRLTQGAPVELFDAAGASGEATIATCDGDALVVVRLESVAPAKTPATANAIALTVAAAVPKGERADWMVEKLSELGVSRFIPLATGRSVVLPEGKNKLARWQRIASESAKQSRRAGVMRIDELTPLERAIDGVAPPAPSPGTPGEGRGEGLLQTTSDVRSRERPSPYPLPEYRDRGRGQAIFLSTEPGAPALAAIPHPPPSILALLIGPEGGWTDGELAMFQTRGLTGCALTTTILRTETAAVVAAAVVLSR